MNESLSHLYNQIEQGKIDKVEGAKQLQQLLSTKTESSTPPIEHSIDENVLNDNELQDQAVQYLKKLLSSVLMMPERQIEADAPLEKYGIDSIMVMKLTDQLETVFGSLSKTLFFEYHNLEELTEYFLKSHRKQLVELLDTGKEQHTQIQPQPKQSLNASTIQRNMRNTRSSKGSTNINRIAEPANDSTTATKSSSSQALDIAIIGLAGRYPEAENISQYWENLKNGKDCITEIPQERWNYKVHTEMKRSTNDATVSGKWGGFIEGVDRFDALFFNISPREAERIDPQERLFLESVYTAIEDAGYTRANLVRSTAQSKVNKVGVYVGVMYQEYQLYGVESQKRHNEPFALNGNPASIANRVSYYFNFHGPSMVVDTMCSSSLTAIHLACQSLQKQECEVAIAGGVNVSVHPNKYVMLTQGHFLSSKGRCESFGEGGDGYVPGEGVGAAILKPLAQAIADGDHIYGVIKGTAINHGGKTNGYTVPNPNQQAEVIDQAIQESAIDPRSISYIEAHGTGTSLGDPIEIAGLTKMFDRYTSDRSFCAIGSAKSNIGHCESAAGIAGITKVLFQMKHQKLAPSIHSQPANPNIDFAKTPFTVQHQLSEWQRPVIAIDHVMTEVPLTAGVSSFGAGGSNAHIVIQEYRSPIVAKQLATPVQPVMIILSAKNEERLKQVVLHFIHHLTEHTYTDQDLADIAYTLCTGREAMDIRLGIVASSVTSLISQLQEYIESDDIPSSVYYGKVQNDLPALPFLSTDEDMTATIQQWVEKRKYSKLLELWVNGIELNWDNVYSAGTFQKISLPTYPFARDRYWVPEVEETHISEIEPKFHSQSILHPLVHTNTSNINVQKYTTVFEGDEFFIADHRIGDEHLLPAVTYLEMARAAVEQALTGTPVQGQSISLQQTVWKHPFVIEQESTAVHIVLFPEQENAIHYEIYTQSDDLAEPIIHCEGIAIIEDAKIEQPLLDIQQIKERCNTKEFTANTCYEAYRQLNMNYGDRHQTIHHLYAGSNEWLAQLHLSEELQVNSQDYVLHPAMVDGALQASIGIWLGREERSQEQETSLPFALEQIDIYHPTTSTMWAHVYQDEVTQSSISKLNIDLIDQTGLLCVRLQGLTSKAIRNEKAILLYPKWEEKAVTDPLVAQHRKYDQHIIMLCEPDLALEQQVKQHFPNAQCISLLPAHLTHVDKSNLSIDQRFTRLATQAFEEIKHILQRYKEDRVFIQMVTVHQKSQKSPTALIALLKTVTLENPNITIQMIETQSYLTNAQIITQLQENQYSADQQIRYESQQRYIQSDYEQIIIPTKTTHSPWKNGGVYLITGGTGGLGMIFAKEIIQQVEQPIVILTGRAASIDESILYSLRSKEATVLYKQLDLTQQEDVTQLIAWITQQYGSLNGIIHSAGMTQDNFIIKKTTDEFNQVLAPKVTGTVHLDLATQSIPLDFFVLFSSVASAFGNAGQADYATANAFMDQYAIDRHKQVLAGERSGQTVSFNWGLWVEGGMHIDKDTAQFLYRTTGMRPLPTVTGLQLFYAGMASNQPQIITLYGDQAQLSSILLSRTNVVPTITDHKVEKEILQIMATILKVDASELDTETEWSEYGFDQTMLADLSHQLNQNFQLQLTALTFVEYTTIQQLTNWIESVITISSQADTNKIADQKGVNLPEPESVDVHEQSNSLQSATMMYLKQTLSTILKLPVDHIEANAPMEKYGIDSITTLQFTEQLEQTFGRLSKTLLFEYQTLSALTTYFIKAHFDILDKQFNISTVQKSSPSVAKAEYLSTNQPKKAIQAQLPGIHSRFKLAYHTHQPVEKHETDIAIIGLSGRYPQADHVDQYWENLKQGIDCITDIPPSRWNNDSLDATSSQNRTQGGFIDGVEQFDPLFFNISPKEAEMMDPQERLFLQTVYQAIEDAGYTRQTLGASTDSNENHQVGVYVGVMYEEYQLYGAQAQALSQSSVALSGNPASIANRVSYFCNFNGPSMAVDTMCSSSLTAIHLACQSLITQECSTAIAGGVNISVHPNKYHMLTQGGFLSSQGRCESFGANGDGYVPGEGVGAVVLKPLSVAQADGDHIYGIIKGSAINHGGKTNGYTVPNPVAQSQVIQQAFQRAGIEPRTISYVEAHGTGTSLGDPIEIAGLNAVYEQNTADKHFCAIGSVKSNIGHCESAAGIAGLTKILLQMKHQQLVPSLHADPSNPNIDFDHIPFVVQKELSQWQRPLLEEHGKKQEIPRRAGLSSFGAGGSNAHLIIEEYTVEPTITTSTDLSENDPVLIVLSAKTEAQLRIQAQQLLEALATDRSVSPLQQIAYTLQVGREAMEERLAFVTHSLSDMKEKLKSYLQPTTQPHSYQFYRGHTKAHKEMLSMLSSDRGFENMIASWLNHRQYNQLLELWVKGLTVDWKLLYSDRQPQRISLPVYPFAKERYWAPDHLMFASSNLSTSLPKAQQQSDRTSIIYKKHWQMSAITESFNSEFTLPADKQVVILMNNKTESLEKHLSAIIPNLLIWDEDELEHQLESTEEQIKSIASFIDLTAWTSDDTSDSNSNIRYTLHKGWLQWLQHWIEINQKTPITLLQVTKGLESFQNISVHLQGAERVGLYRMLQHEYAHVRSKHIDFDMHASEERTAFAIMQELLFDFPDVEVCYRSDQRWVAYLGLVENMPDFNTTPAQQRSFDPEQVLWITGGTRGLGMLCAQHFVAQYGVKKLVLSGQEVLPPRKEWHLYDHQTSITAEKIKSIVQLEKQGVQIYATSVDLTSVQEVQKVIDEVHSELGSISGVIHCAGTADQINPAFIRKQAESVESVMNPKIKGLHTLHQCLQQEPLQFWVLFSSVAATIPSLAVGQSDYAMANAYMDYFAEASTDAYPIYSIQWPSWKETGFGEVKSKPYEQTGLLSMTNTEGLLLLDCIMNSSKDSVILPAVIDQEIAQPSIWMTYQPSVFSDKLIAEQNVQSAYTPAPSIAMPESDELHHMTLDWLRKLIADELKVDVARLDDHTPFAEYGIDSILLAQIITTLDRTLQGTAVDPTMMLEYPTIQQLAEQLVYTYPLELVTLFTNDTTTEQVASPSPSIIEKAQDMYTPMSEKQQEPKQKIAVIGIGCHFPDANDPLQFWNNLKSGKDSIQKAPSSRQHQQSNRIASYDSTTHVRYGAFLPHIEQFDPAYFGISESLAVQIDPLQRQLLEVSVEAATDAGYTKKQLSNTQTGVFVGSRTSNYSSKVDRTAKDTIVGIGQNFIAAHLAHFYNLKGPNLVVDTACSSSLTAIHLAVQSIQNGECELAFAGGVDILLDEVPFETLGSANVLSTDSRCKTFSADADGIGLGEGCGVMILKPLHQAIADQDGIYGVIDGSALNNDGNTMGITTPNPEAQKELVYKAVQNADIDPSTISYIETHGTGTLIGDPIELKALTSVFSGVTDRQQFCGVGSVKSNIGHLLSAAGVASFIKVLLSLVHEELPPTIHCEVPNPRFRFEQSPFYIVQQHQKWSHTQGVLRAGISAFGLGGNNAHILVSNEGIPASYRRQLPLSYSDVGFNRQRYWPTEPQEYATSGVISSEATSDFFDVIKVGEGSE